MNFKHSYVPKVYFLLLILLLPVYSMSQDIPADSDKPQLFLSLQEAMERVREQNFDIGQAEYDVDKIRGQYRQTNAAFLPQLSIEETGVSTNDPLNVFGFRLKQEAVTQADFNPSRLNDPDAYDNFTTKFELRQPLLNTDMLLERSAVKKQLEASKEKLKGTQDYARYQVKDTYYQLQLMNNRLSVIDRSLETAEENERQAKNLYDQEMINKADYLAANVRVLELESQQSKVEDQLQTIQDNLRYLLNMDDELTIVPTDSLQVRPGLSDAMIDPENTDNAGVRAMEHRVSAAKQMLKASKFNFMPSINLFGSYEFNDEVPFGTQGNSYMIGATLKWNLFSGFSNIGKVMESKAELKQAKLAYESKIFRNKLDIQQALRSLDQARSQLRFAESSVMQADEDYRIRNNRYEQGMEKTTDLLSAETRLQEAKFQRLNALYQYNLSMATLELLLEQERVY